MPDSAPLTAPAPTRYSARREEILAAAAAVLDNQGSRGFTVASVAKRLGLHPVSLTYYFKRRQDLLAATLLATIERYNELIAVAELFHTPEERLWRLIAEHFAAQRQAREGRAPPLARFSELVLVPQPAGAMVMAAYRRMYERLASLFEAPDHPWLTVGRRSFYARLMIEQFGWTPGWLAYYEPRDYARAAERFADVLIGGLAAPGRDWPATTKAALGAPVNAAAEPSREQFLLAATELINEQGYHGASVDKISARLNVTKGSFYYHNEDKDELILACFDRTLDLLREGQTRPYPGDGWERLCAAVASLAAHQASGDRGRMLRGTAFAALPPDLRRSMELRFQQPATRFSAMVMDGVADGSIRPVDPMIAAQTLMATINSSAYLAAFTAGDPTVTVETDYVRPSLTGLFRAN